MNRPRTKADRKPRNDKLPLEELDILLEPFAGEGCPNELLNLFRLIRDSQYLRFEGFAGYKVTKEGNVEQRNKVARDYDKELASRALELKDICSDPKRPDDSENEWTAALKPVAFHRFHREKEETDPSHHW